MHDTTCWTRCSKIALPFIVKQGKLWTPDVNCTLWLKFSVQVRGTQSDSAGDRFSELEKRFHFESSNAATSTASTQQTQPTPFEALVNSTAGLAAAAGLAARNNNVPNSSNTNSNELFRQINALLDNTLDLNSVCGGTKSHPGREPGMPLPPPGLSPPANSTSGMSSINSLNMIMNGGGRSTYETDNHVESGKLSCRKRARVHVLLLLNCNKNFCFVTSVSDHVMTMPW